MVNVEYGPVGNRNIRNEPTSLSLAKILRGKDPDIDLNKVSKIDLGNFIGGKAESIRQLPGGGGLFITIKDGKIEVDEPRKVAEIKNPAVLSIGGKQRLREIGVFLHTAPDVPSPTDLSHLLSGKDDPQSAKCVIVTSDGGNIAVFPSKKTHTKNPDEISQYDSKWKARILELSNKKEPVSHIINRVIKGKPRNGWFGLNADSRQEIFKEIIKENGFIVFSGTINSSIMEREGVPATFNEGEVVAQKANSNPLLRGKAPRAS